MIVLSKVMSVGTRATRLSSTSKMDDAPVSVSITASEVESIVQKAVLQAVTEIKELINNKLAELDNRISATESRILAVEERLSQMELCRSVVNNDDTTALSMELDAVRSESRESLLLANDNEQFSRRNNLRLCGLKSVNGEDCRLTAANFI